MPNGFHGPVDEWRKLEAPYVRIDPILTSFATRHGLELNRNYRDADRSLRWNDALSRAIWIGATDKYGERGTYMVSVLAHQDRPERWIKGEVVAQSATIDELPQTLEHAHGIVTSWSANDLEPAKRQK